MLHYKNLNDFFSEVLSDLSCDPKTRSYIISVFCKYKNANFDLSNDSLTILYFKAREKMDFATFQNIGDWIMFSESMKRNNLKHASEEYYDELAKISYWNCFKLINKQWLLFEELSDNFTEIKKEIRNSIYLE